MDNNDIEVVKEKKKQKGALGIRPNDYVESAFKDKAKELGRSQTELFTKMFWNYISTERGEDEAAERAKRLSVLDCSKEMDLIDSSLKTILQSFDTIVSNAQDNILESTKIAHDAEEHIEKRVATATMEKDNRIMQLELELNKVTLELEENKKVNIALAAAKDEHDAKLMELNELLAKRDAEKVELEETIKNQLKGQQNLEIKIENSLENISTLEGKLDLANKTNKSLVAEKSSLEVHNNSLTSIVDHFNNLKKAELESIKIGYESNVEMIKQTFEAKRNLEFNQLNIKIQELEETIKDQLKGQQNLENKIEDSLENISTLEGKLDLANKTNKSLIAEKSSLDSEFTQLNIKIQELEEINKDLTKQLKRKKAPKTIDN